MAGPAHDYHRGEMEIEAQRSTFHGFIALIKWSSLAIAVGVLFLTIWLAAGAGFFRAALAALVLTVVGVMMLKEKPGSGH